MYFSPRVWSTLFGNIDVEQRIQTHIFVKNPSFHLSLEHLRRNQSEAQRMDRENVKIESENDIYSDHTSTVEVIWAPYTSILEMERKKARASSRLIDHCTRGWPALREGLNATYTSSEVVAPTVAILNLGEVSLVWRYLSRTLKNDEKWK